MNKPTALLAVLWKHDLPFLKYYLQRNHRIVFLFSDIADQETIQAIETMGSQVKTLQLSINPSVIEEANQAIMFAMNSLQVHKASKQAPCTSEEKVLLETYKGVLTENLPFVISLLNELQQIEDEYFIESILLNEEISWQGKTIAGWAKQHGIPSILLSHDTRIPQSCNFERYQSETIAVAGDRSAECYFDSAVPRERIEVIGNPNWNIFKLLMREKRAVRQALCEQSGLDIALPIIVFSATRNTCPSILDDRNLLEELNGFFFIYPQLLEKGFQAQLVVIDQLATDKNNQKLVLDIVRQLGIPSVLVRCVLSEVESWIAAADVVVSFDSNISAQALLAETPAINLITPFNLLAGPTFSPEDPLLHCELAALADMVEQVLNSEKLRAELQLKMRGNAERFNRGIDGRSEERLYNLIKIKNRVNPADGVANYAWQTLRRELLPLIKGAKHTLLNQANKWKQTKRLLKLMRIFFRK